MKIILLEDVKALGKKHDVVRTSDGYARNYLIPRNLAVEATDANRSVLKRQLEAEAKKAAERKAQAEALAGKLKKTKTVLYVKVGGSGRLFGAVASKDIADALKEQYGYEIDKKKIVLDEPIKELGEYAVDVRLHKDVTAKLSIQVREA